MKSTLMHLCQYYDCPLKKKYYPGDTQEAEAPRAVARLFTPEVHFFAPVNSAFPLFLSHIQLIFIITSCNHNVLFMFSWTMTLGGPPPHVVNCREGLQGCPLEGKKGKAFRGPTAGGGGLMEAEVLMFILIKAVINQILF